MSKEGSGRFLRIVRTAAWLLAATSVAAYAQSWQTAQQLSDSADNSGSCKGPYIGASASGGFHAMYRYNSQIRYRKYNGVSLNATKTLASGTVFGGDICEAGNGVIHVVWENWDSTPDIGWVKSTDGGSTFSSAVEITSFTNVGKWPHLARYGGASGPEVIMTCGKADGKQMWFNRWNGTSWGGATYTGFNYESEYQIFGLCRSLQDGSVYMSVDDRNLYPAYSRYNGISWSALNDAHSTGFFARQSIAVNPLGQVMMCWEKDDHYYSKLYTPGTGWGTLNDFGNHTNFGGLVAIPDSNDFYVIYVRDLNHVVGRKYSGGGWLSEEAVSVGQAYDFTPDTRLSVGSDGTLYAAWEYWGSGDARSWYSVKAAPALGPRGTIAGTVVDQNGTGVSGVAISAGGQWVTISSTGGAYSLRLPTGTYTVTPSKDFYTGTASSNVVVNQDQTTTVNFTVTASAPGPVTNFVVTGYNAKNRLVWTNPGTGNHTGSRIRVSTSSFPSSPTAGTQVADVASTVYSYEHTGLTNNTTYYYSVFAYYDDASRFYASAAQASGIPVAPPKPNLLANASLDTFSSGVASSWTSYKVNDPNNAITFSSDTTNYVTSPAQAINGIDSASLPATGVSAAGIRQVVSGTTAGKVYFFVARQDLYASDFGADSRRYALHFGIDPAGGTSAGSPAFDCLIGNAKWMTSSQTLFNDNGGSPVRFGGFHKSWAGVAATASSISVWTGVTINNTAAKDNVAVKFNTDHAFLYEFDFPANPGLQNGDFESSVLNLQDVDPWYGGGDMIPTYWVPSGGSIGQWSDILANGDAYRSGTRGLRIGNRRGTVNGGVMQKIGVTQGLYQTFTAYAAASGSDSTVAAIGIDPYGGGDINSTNVVWATTSATAWTPLEVNTVAQSGTVTVFLRSLSTNASTGNYHYSQFDDCAFFQTTVPNPGDITGTVTDGCGNVVVGATVSTNVGGYTTTSSENGTYLLNDVAPGTYNVTAVKSGLPNKTVNGVVVSANQTTTCNLQMQSSSAGKIVGTVTDECGSPLANATVTTNTGGYTATTNSDGAYTMLNVTAGTYNVTAAATGFTSKVVNSQTVTACGTLTVNFNLSPQTFAETLSNKDYESGFYGFWGGQIANSWGAVWRSDFNAASWGDTTLTGHGHVQEVYGVATGFEAGVLQQISGLKPGSQFTFAAQAYQLDTGTNAWIAVDSNGGTTLPSRTTYFDNIANQWNSKSVTGTVGSSGTVTVFLWAYHQWGAGASVYFDNASLLVENEGLGTTGSIGGVVRTGSGSPISGATVTSDVGGYTATSGADGSYVIPKVIPGIYTLTATANGYVENSQTNISVVGCVTSTVNFTMQAQPVSQEKLANGNMEGGFWDTGWGGGSKIPNSWTGWYNPGDANCYDDTTVKHGGSHSALFTISAGGNAGGGGYKRGIYQNVNVGANANFTITVWARHTNGNCPSIMCWNPNQNATNPQDAYTAGRYTWVTTDNWGQLNTWVSNTINGTAPAGGWITVIVGGAHYGGGGAGSIYIDDVSVTAAAGPTTGNISGTVKDASNNAIAGASVATSTGGYTATSGTDGSYTLANVPAGTYDVTATKAGYQSQTQTGTVVTAGQTTTKNFTLTLITTFFSNGNMEGGFWDTGWGGGSKIPNSWQGWYNPGDFNCFDDTAVKHAGSHAARTTISAGGDAATGGYKRGIYQNVYVGPNANFTITTWARHTNGNCPSIMCYNPEKDTTNPHTAYLAGRYKWVTTDNWGQLNTWVSNTLGGTAPASGWVTVIIGGAHHGGGGVGTVYIDDVNVTVP